MLEEKEYYVAEGYFGRGLVQNGPVYTPEAAIALAKTLYPDKCSESIIIERTWDWGGSEHNYYLTYDEAKNL